MIEEILNFPVSDFYYCLYKKAEPLLYNYSISYIKEDSIFNESSLIDDLKKSKILAINRLNNLYPENKFLVICSQEKIFLIQEKSLHLLQSLLSNISNLSICFLKKDVKTIFSKYIKIEYQNFLYDKILDELKIFSDVFRTREKKHTTIFKELRNILDCINVYLIQQAYLSNIHQYRFNDLNQEIKTIEKEEEEKKEKEKPYVPLRHIGSGSSFYAELVYHFETRRLYVNKKVH